MTYNDPTIIREILENHGVVTDSSPDATIYAYEPIAGQMYYTVFYWPEYDDMSEPPDVAWRALLMLIGGLTNAGRLWLKMGGGKTGTIAQGEESSYE